MIETREPLVINERANERVPPWVEQPCAQGEPALSVVYAPLVVGGEARA